jgi:hypothetical protein
MAASFNAPFNPFSIRVSNTDGAGATTNYTTTRGLYVIDVVARKTSAGGGGGPNNQFTVGETANVITTINLDNVGDNVVIRASVGGTLNATNSDIVAGGTLRVVTTRVAAENIAFDADVICIAN